MPPDAHRSFIKVVSVDWSLVQAPIIPHSHRPVFLFVKPAKVVVSTAPTLLAVAPKTQDHAQPICVCDMGCLVTPLEFNLLVCFCCLSSSLHFLC